MLSIFTEVRIIDMFDTQQYKKKLDALSSSVLSAYLDSVVFMSIVKLAKEKQRTNVFVFDYSYYAIRNRAIISAKRILEKSSKDKLTLDTVLKELQQNEKYKDLADGLHKEYKELLNSEGAQRVKEFRDSLCHNIQYDSEKMIYCKDITAILNTTMNILQDIYQHVFNTLNTDFFKIQQISMTLADDYWVAICEQADKMPKRTQELTELQRMLDCGK